MHRLLVLNVFPLKYPRQQAVRDVTEIWSLVDSLGDAKIIDMHHYYRQAHSSTFIGPDNLQNLRETVKTNSIDTVVVNAIIKPMQLFRIYRVMAEENPAIRVWDRIDLILNIFQQHARTSEAKLQIRMATIRHMGPRMYGMGRELSQQGGGIGTRGIGETNLQLMKRHWKSELHTVKTKLNTLTETRRRQMLARHARGTSTASLVGYTNAGKSTLFNRLTGKRQYADNRVFATLDSVTGRLINGTEPVLLSDTIGFIRNLPPALIDAFRSTLMESIHADVLVHVIDASSPSVEEEISTVEQVLYDMGLSRKRRLLVFNKMDEAGEQMKRRLDRKFSRQSRVFVSAKNGDGMDYLVTQLEKIAGR